jgi:hypothetical protein
MRRLLLGIGIATGLLLLRLAGAALTLDQRWSTKPERGWRALVSGFIDLIHVSDRDVGSLTLLLALGIASVAFGVSSRRLAFFRAALALAGVHVFLALTALRWRMKGILAIKAVAPEYLSLTLLREAGPLCWNVSVLGLSLAAGYYLLGIERSRRRGNLR